jgi:hypothetical protein
VRLHQVAGVTRMFEMVEQLLGVHPV